MLALNCIKTLQWRGEEKKGQNQEVWVFLVEEGRVKLHHKVN